MVVFGTFVYSGNVMKVSTTLLANLMIGRIMGPIGRISGFYMQMLASQVSLTRVHEFLSANESQPNVLYRENLDAHAEATVIKIRGNYTFGFGE